jgi:hypothetical protein
MSSSSLSAGTCASGCPRTEPGRGRSRKAVGTFAANARLKQDRSARVIIAGHAFIQNIRRGHYELAVEEPTNRRLVVAFDELVLAI